MRARFPTRIARAITLFSPRHLKSNQRGFSLTETVVALAILIMSSTAGLSLFGRAIKVTHTAKYYTEAIYIADALMEVVRSTDFADITTDFPSGVAQPVQQTVCHEGESRRVIQPSVEAHLAHGDTVDLCNPEDNVEGGWLPDAATWTVTYPNGEGADPLAITVTVSWPEGGITESIQLTTEAASL